MEALPVLKMFTEEGGGSEDAADGHSGASDGHSPSNGASGGQNGSTEAGQEAREMEGARV